MKQLSPIETAVYLAGALLMVIGAGANVFALAWAPYCFMVGALAFTLMQAKQTYDGPNFVIRRLRRIMLISNLLMIAAATLMIVDRGNMLRLDYISYVQYVHNKWVVVLLIAAILQLYTSHRIGHELDKEAKKL